MNTKYLIRGAVISTLSAGALVVTALSAAAGRYNGRY